MRTKRRFLAIIGLAALTVASAQFAAFAADPPAKAHIVNIQLKDTSVKSIIDAIFRGTQLKYRVDNDVSGKLGEIRLTGVTADRAIRDLAHIANLTVRIENGVYIIAPNNVVVLGITRRRTVATTKQQPTAPSGSTTEVVYVTQQPVTYAVPDYPAYWGPPVQQIMQLGPGLQMMNSYGYGPSPIYQLSGQPFYSGMAPYYNPFGFGRPY
jgi:hypothetical protein